MLFEMIHRLSSQRGHCKSCGVILGIAVLLAGALGGLGKGSLLWIAAPLVLLGLVDAGYAAQQRRCEELLKRPERNEDATAFLPETAGTVIRRFCSAVLSLSVWPFYLSLLGMVVAAAFYMPVKVSAPSVARAAVSSPMGNLPGQPYRSNPMNGMPPQYFPQRPPFPARTPMGQMTPHSGGGLPTVPWGPPNGRPTSPPPQRPSSPAPTSTR